MVYGVFYKQKELFSLLLRGTKNKFMKIKLRQSMWLFILVLVN